MKLRAEPLKEVTPPMMGLATLPTTLPPLVSGSAREVSDIAVSLNVVGVEVGAQWYIAIRSCGHQSVCKNNTSLFL